MLRLRCAPSQYDRRKSTTTPAKPSPNPARFSETHHVDKRLQPVRRCTVLWIRRPRDWPKLFNHIINFLLKRISPRVLADAQRHTDQVRASGLDWTIVRVPMLQDGPSIGNVRVGWVGENVGIRVSRSNVADFMLKQLTDNTYVHQAPVISN